MPSLLPPADDAAIAAFDSLTAGIDFAVTPPDLTDDAYQVPDATGPLYATITHLTNADLTTGVINGSGTFDALMTGFRAHLEGEFRNSRITGAEYTKAFIALTEGAMSNAVQFLLGRDQAYWQAMTAQIGARIAQTQLVTANVTLEIAKHQLRQAILEGESVKARYALDKMKLATEGIGYDSAAYALENLLPLQKTLLTEQIEVQRAQTLDFRLSDEEEVVGVVGKQKALYTQQVASYKRDSELKATKIFSDAWMTMKTIDEALEAPTGFENASLDAILTTLKTNNDL